jgi:ubiquitin-like protein Pup
VVRVPTHDDGQARASRKAEEVEETAEVTDSAAEVAERKAKLTEDVDDLLDEIDDVLESNAEDFVRGYVQKGGQ